MYFVLWIVLAIIVGAWAERWGRSGPGWLFLSLILSPLLGGLILLVSGENKKGLERAAIKYGDMQKCPYCAEIIKKQAIVCRFCGKFCGKDLNVPTLHDAIDKNKPDVVAVKFPDAGRAAGKSIS